MPTKLKNRGTLLYNSVRDVLYERVPNKDEPYNKEIRWNLKRPAWLRQYELTATPIERDPGDQFSCVRLIDPNILGTSSKFEKEHVLLRDPFSKKPKKWTRVDRIGHKLNHMMHRVDKTDPKVAPYFPKLIEEPVYIDWNDRHRKIYDTLASKAALELEEGEDVSILALINALQMICDAPSMINMSALKREEFENLLMEASEDEEVVRQGSEIAMKLMQQLGELSDEGHPKLQRLKEDLTERYLGDKVIFFSTWAEYLHPIITKHLDEWGVTYEVYAGTDKQRQTAKDHWRSDPDCSVLVSSDAGSDSVDLPEASLVINYNLPWLFSRLRQRINRASRADSGHATLRVLNYLMADSVEERRMALIEVRRGYHEEFTSLSTKESRSAGYTMDDLLFALLGSDSGVVLDGGGELDLQEQHF
jgi:SNF2 family DNA or RNA helicase